jgi:hypothetical protein
VKQKVVMAVAPFFAVVAFAVAPAVAQAEPHWYANGIKLAEAETVPVTTAGALTLEVKEETKTYKVKCKVAGKGTVVNPTGGGAGTDQITELVFSSCKLGKTETPPCVGEPITVTAGGLPWASVLAPLGTTTRILDKITVTALEIKCGATLLHSFTGTWTPRVGISKKTNGGVLSWGVGSGELTSGTVKMTAKGASLITGPTGKERITARNP